MPPARTGTKRSGLVSRVGRRRFRRPCPLGRWPDAEGSIPSVGDRGDESGPKVLDKSQITQRGCKRENTRLQFRGMLAARGCRP